MATKSKGRSNVARTAAKLLDGTAKHLGGCATVLLAGASLAQADVAARLQRVIDLRANVTGAKATVLTHLAVEQAEAPQHDAFMAAFQMFVKAAFDGKPDVLADFGIHLKERAPLSVEARALAAAKRAATRAARGTKGPRERLKIKGDVTGVDIAVKR